MYAIVKIWVRLALQFYCARIDFDIKNLCKEDKAMILACSHPNSFFDALVIGAYHPRKLHFLARGDAFGNPFFARLLRMLNLIPIYRISEGKENLENNRQTFDECIDIFKSGGTVLIFSEGISINEWGLRPLKKGTARLASMCWDEFGVDDMVVQPVGLNYNSYTALPKHVYVQYGNEIEKDGFDLSNTPVFYKQFNEVLTTKLQALLLPEGDSSLQQKKANVLLKILLALPALVGMLLHRPLFVLWRGYIRKRTEGTVFYDSVLFASMLLLYPALVLMVTIVSVITTGYALWWLLLIMLPATAWCYTRYKSI